MISNDLKDNEIKKTGFFSNFLNFSKKIFFIKEKHEQGNISRLKFFLLNFIVLSLIEEFSNALLTGNISLFSSVLIYFIINYFTLRYSIILKLRRINDITEYSIKDKNYFLKYFNNVLLINILFLFFLSLTLALSIPSFENLPIEENAITFYILFAFIFVLAFIFFIYVTIFNIKLIFFKKIKIDQVNNTVKNKIEEVKEQQVKKELEN